MRHRYADTLWEDHLEQISGTSKISSPEIAGLRDYGRTLYVFARAQNVILYGGVAKIADFICLVHFLENTLMLTEDHSHGASMMKSRRKKRVDVLTETANKTRLQPLGSGSFTFNTRRFPRITEL